MTNLRTSTERYVEAFNAKDLDRVASHMAHNFKLTDPEVTALTPKTEVVEYIKCLFDTNEFLRFVAHRILVDGDTSVIHFTLTLGDSVLDGVDVITWDDAQMTSMHAYLTPRQ